MLHPPVRLRRPDRTTNRPSPSTGATRAAPSRAASSTRGDAIDGLNGAYLYADYCTSRLWGLAQQDGDWTIRELVDPGAIGWRIVSFAVDEDGEALNPDQQRPPSLRLIAAPDG